MIMLGYSLSREIIDFFMNIPIFSRINAEELKVIAKHMSERRLKVSDVLFNEGDRGHFVCFVVSGELEVIKRSDVTDKDVVIAEVNQGQSIGEMSIIDDGPRSATVRAKTDVVLYVLSKSAFDLILDKHSKIGIKLLKGISYLLSVNLRDTSNRLADFMPALS